MEKNCEVCNKEFHVPPSREETAKCCSKSCSIKLRLNTKINCACTNCSKEFYMKPSQKRRSIRNQGFFCSTKCVGEYRKKSYMGEKNPNFRSQITREEGYKLSYSPKFGRVKLHQQVVYETLNITSIPKLHAIHHRDCDVDNNEPINLVVLSKSDHQWLHKQFGNATLWAFINNKISLDELITWTNDIERAKRLLTLSILDQIAVIKSGEFMETLEVDNHEPS